MYSIITAVQQVESFTGVQPQVPESLRKSARSHYGLLGVERNKYINISELLSFDLSHLVPLNISAIKNDVALQHQRRPSIAPPNPSDFSQ